MPRSAALSATLIVFLLTACSGNNNIPAQPSPVFTSTPVTQAVEGTSYSYQLAASGNAVAFSMSSAPTGATLSGNTVSWTPTAAQARTSNSFTVSATAPGSTPATQSWTVTPSGTIRVSRVDTLWSSTGTSRQPYNWNPTIAYVAALVPQSDGSFQTLSGTAGSDGSLTIGNVPAGYYWLRLSPREIYWTNSSTFDAGSDISSAASFSTTSVATTYFSYNFTGLDASATGSQVQLDALESRGMSFAVSQTPGSTMLATGNGVSSNIDFSVIKNAFVRQYEPVSIGAVKGYVLGPALTLTNLSLTSGSHNTITGELKPVVPASTRFSIKASDWTSLFDRVSPTPVSTSSSTTSGTTTTTGIIVPVILTGPGRSFTLSAEPYIDANGPNLSSVTPINLILTQGTLSGFLRPLSTCAMNLPLNTDVGDADGATVQYSDPYPSGWRRTFTVCQSATANLKLADGSTQGVSLTDTQTTVPPTGPVKPLLSAVQNPKINGSDLFATTTIKGGAVTLSWDAPATGTAFGYSVAIYSAVSLPNGTAQFLAPALLSTAKTSMVVPPDLVRPGQTYYFIITAQADAKANMETSPHRSSLPTASAQLVSAPVTIAN